MAGKNVSACLENLIIIIFSFSRWFSHFTVHAMHDVSLCSFLRIYFYCLRKCCLDKVENSECHVHIESKDVNWILLFSFSFLPFVLFCLFAVWMWWEFVPRNYFWIQFLHSSLGFVWTNQGNESFWHWFGKFNFL